MVLHPPFKGGEKMLTRRRMLQTSAMAGSAVVLPGFFGASRVSAVPLAPGLSDPLVQPKFVELVPNALDPAFLYKDLNEDGKPAMKPDISIMAGENVQETGLIDPKNGKRLKTRIWGYGNDTITWPGQTVQVVSSSAGGADETIVRWANEIRAKVHLLPVDESLHWCYSLHGNSSVNGVDYREYSIKRNGVPIVPHLHGGRTDFQFDGNPEYFFSTDSDVKGPQWDFVEGGFQTDFRYDNGVPAGNLWYHDHALGITRLNVYAGLAGFYFVRDEFDTGQADNPLGLPAFPYELAYAIQDRMFTDSGALFYPAYPGDPFYDDFITGEGAILPPDIFADGGPTALAEFFGDHVVVNGKIWPKANVEPRNYRMRLLNGCDSRFMVLRFRVAADPSSTDLDGAGAPVPFWVIGMDQGFAKAPTQVDTLVFEPGGRYDIVFDFSDVPPGSRVIMENIGGDAPFGGAFGDDLDPADVFPARQTDRVMAFDVVMPFNESIPDAFDPTAIPGWGGNNEPFTFRQVALFEGTDEFGRLQPLLGTVNGDGTATGYSWFQDTTETVALGSTEVWEIYNFTGDAHPIHLHLVNFEVLDRQEFEFTADGTNPVPQHNGTVGEVVNVTSITETVGVPHPSGIVENGPRDMVTALPGDPDSGVGQKVSVKATFDKPGRYVWHCHILSHEDHEMMRVLDVLG